MRKLNFMVMSVLLLVCSCVSYIPKLHPGAIELYELTPIFIERTYMMLDTVNRTYRYICGSYVIGRYEVSNDTIYLMPLAEYEPRDPIATIRDLKDKDTLNFCLQRRFLRRSDWIVDITEYEPFDSFDIHVKKRNKWGRHYKKITSVYDR